MSRYWQWQDWLWPNWARRMFLRAQADRQAPRESLPDRRPDMAMPGTRRGMARWRRLRRSGDIRAIQRSRSSKRYWAKAPAESSANRKLAWASSCPAERRRELKELSPKREPQD